MAPVFGSMEVRGGRECLSVVRSLARSGCGAPSLYLAGGPAKTSAPSGVMIKPVEIRLRRHRHNAPQSPHLIPRFRGSEGNRKWESPRRCRKTWSHQLLSAAPLIHLSLAYVGQDSNWALRSHFIRIIGT